MTLTKLTSYEAICLIIILFLNTIIFELPNSFIKLCNSGAIINVIFVSILAFIFFFSTYKLLRNMNNTDLLTTSEFIGGIKLKKLIGISYISYIILYASTILRDFSETLHITFLYHLPLYIIIALLIIPAAFSAIQKNITFTTTIFIIPFIIVSLIIVFFNIFYNLSISKLFPIFGHNLTSELISGSSNIFAFSGLGYIFFILPYLNQSDLNQGKTIKISFIIITLLLFFSILSLILGLPFVRYMTELSPIYLLTRSGEIGEFVESPEVLLLFIWILSLISLLSTTILSVKYLIRKTFNLPDTTDLVPLISNSIFLIAIIPNSISQIKYIEISIMKYFSIILIFIISGLIIFLGNQKYKRLNLKGDIKINEY